MVDWGAIRADYPLLERTTYLDTASVSPNAPVIRDAIGEFYDEKDLGFLGAGWRERKDDCQHRLADYLGVRPHEIVFLSSTTEAVNQLTNAFSWQSGDEVIISELNFASNVYPWSRLEAEGVDLTVVESTDGTIDTSQIGAAVTNRTRVVSLPHVSTTTGHRVSLTDLRSEVGDDVFINIDGVQAVGYCRPNLGAVDAYSFSIFKWLLGPFGLGVMYLDESASEDLEPSMVGYGSVSERVEGPSHEFTLKDGTQKFQYSHANYPAIYALDATLSYLTDIGTSRIRDRVDDLMGELLSGLESIDPVDVITKTSARAGIVAFDHQVVETGTLVDSLAGENIHVADRGGHVRASCHFYNNHQDVNALLSALADLT